MKIYDLEVVGNVTEFENLLLEKSTQELRKGMEGSWTKMADRYAIQLEMIRYIPIPEVDSYSFDDELPPVFRSIYKTAGIKLIDKERIYPYLFYRWGLKVKGVGNYRIIYCIHNYYKVVLLHYFEKTYNGSIRRKDLLPAEYEYELLCYREPAY